MISPAQAGFVVMHGCEYHIFTLLETLRDRVRHGQDTVLVFLDFKKAYDSVSQPLAWKVLHKLGIPSEFISLLESWTAQSRISLRMGGNLQKPFPQELGVPQGGVLSPIIFNFFIEVLLRHVNAKAGEFGVELAAVNAELAGKDVPPALRLLALAYADDVVLICRDMASAQKALDMVQEWAADFGMTIGVGQGKTEAMLVSAGTVVQACADDVNGMLKRGAVGVTASSDEDPAPLDEDMDDDDDLSTVLDDDDEWLPGSPVVRSAPRPSCPPLRKGQAFVNGEVRGAGTGKPLPYVPRPLPVLPDLPFLHISTLGVDGGEATFVDIPWTSLYKYLGFMLRADLLDDHAYERVEKKTKAAAERLFPHHRLVKAWPLGLQLQLLQTLVLSVTANIMPLLTSMRCASETKTSRLDKLCKKIALSTLRLQGSARRAYVTAEAGLGDVMGLVTQHRLRLALSLVHHPFRDLHEPPIACRVHDIICAEAPYFNSRRHSLLLAPWTCITERVVMAPLSRVRDDPGNGGPGLGWQEPVVRREVAPFASVVARLGERSRWIEQMRHGLDWMSDSFALRPPPGTRRQTAALHWASRLQDDDAGHRAKLWPLSYRGPRGCSIVELSRRRSALTSLISGMRQGNASMQRFPFVATKHEVVGGVSGFSRHLAWKTCRLCDLSDGGPRYDLWHVLFDCPKTSTLASVVAVRDACQAFVLQLCDFVTVAVGCNGDSMSNTERSGVSHSDIYDAELRVRDAAPGYLWDCVPGRWLVYTLLLALPFSERVVRPNAPDPVWLCPPKRKRGGVVPERDLHGMPVVVPELPAEQYVLPEALGRLYDCTVLSSDSLRPLADAWCKFATGNLLRVGNAVRPLRAAVDVQLVASAVVLQQQNDDDSRSGSSGPDDGSD